MEQISNETSGNPEQRNNAGKNFRNRPRRRGRVLENAIYDAVLKELAERGFAGLTFKRVAELAGTGKSAIYRRWATKLDLIADTFTHALPDPASFTSSGNLRDDLLRHLREMAESLAGPVGTAIRANVAEAQRHPELYLTLREQVTEDSRRIMYDLLSAGVQRGEVRPEALIPDCIEAGPALLRQRFLESGMRIPDDAIISLVDNVLIPMLRPK